MKRTWAIIGVGGVPRSFKWYQALFGQPVTLATKSLRVVAESIGRMPDCLSGGAVQLPFRPPILLKRYSGWCFSLPS
jgi:hypothetical protein